MKNLSLVFIAFIILVSCKKSDPINPPTYNPPSTIVSYISDTTTKNPTGLIDSDPVTLQNIPNVTMADKSIFPLFSSAMAPTKFIYLLRVKSFTYSSWVWRYWGKTLLHSTIAHHQVWFRLDVNNLALVLNFNFLLKYWDIVVGGCFSNILTTPCPVRWRSFSILQPLNFKP